MTTMTSPKRTCGIWRTAKLGDVAAKFDSAMRTGLQAQLAQAMGVTPGRVSQIERGELATIDAVARHVQALGGKLGLIASFGDHTLTVATTEAA
jgi:hypothetical protein